MAGTTSRARQILFRIFYSTSFTIVFLLTIAVACAGPIDAVYQSFRRNRLIDIFIIAGCYFIVGLVAVFLYASRLYTNRSILKDIPKTYMPIQKPELPVKKVWRLIEDCKSRSAVIAYQARPRSRRVEIEVPYARARINTLLKPEHSKEYRIFEPQWGTISHPGWSSPAATETPNLEYATVVAELTDLIEARAVSLAPTDPTAPLHEDGIPKADEYVIEALRRPEECGMRQYISQLTSLDVLDENSLSVAFLTLYERARFAPEPLSEDEFKSLMRMFAEILRTMKTLDASRLDIPDDTDDDDDTLDEDTSNFVTPTMQRSLQLPQTHLARRHSAMTSYSSLADSIVESVRHHTNVQPSSSIAAKTHPPPRVSEDGARSITSTEGDACEDADEDSSWTNPTSRPPFFRGKSSLSNTAGGIGSKSRSRITGRRRRRSRVKRTISKTSIKSGGTSLRSVGSKGSVIRLNPEFDGRGEGLPFEYVPQTVEGGEDDGGSVRRVAL